MIAAFKHQLTTNADYEEPAEDEEDEELDDALGDEELEEQDLEEEWEAIADNEDNPEIEEFAHFTCKSHALQNALKEVFEKAGSRPRELRRAVFKKITRFRKSHVATAKLFEATGLSLRIEAKTRWSFCAIVYERLLEVFASFNTISGELRWDVISHADRTEIQLVMEVLRPVKSFNVLQSNSPTISLVLPGLLTLL
jgi:hypothetical protein